MIVERARHSLLLTRTLAQEENPMPMAVLLVSGHRVDIPSLRAARALAELGTTGVTVLSGNQTLALVLEGWAFDPVRAFEAAEDVLPAGIAQPSILETQFHVTVHGGPEGG